MTSITQTLTILIAQLNPVLGDIKGNAAKALQALHSLEGQQADLILFPELFIVGYPPEDLVLKPAFQQAARQAVEKLAASTKPGEAGLLVGTPWVEGGKLYNAVALLADGKVQEVRYKVDLPNYSVFDEKRVFAAGVLPEPINFRGVRIGLPICEDVWASDYPENICLHLKGQGAEILLSPNGSPFMEGKRHLRLEQAQARVGETGLPLVYANQVGGQDELVFDGASFVIGANGQTNITCECWQEQLCLTQWEKSGDSWQCITSVSQPEESRLEGIYMACVLGLRDYVEKNGFPGVVLGLSGGVDSALCAAMAVDALGIERVHTIMMPYKYTSEESLKDAADCARAMNLRYDIVPIAKGVEALTEELAPLFKGKQPDVTEENIQSRSRGVILMAVSNKFGYMVVTTGNKSEMSVGYATLYGDMNGGFNPIKDIYKTLAFELCHFRNAHKPTGCLGNGGEVIPVNIITKPPTAELREGQQDSDSLPPYEVLDDILQGLVEKEMSLPEIIAKCHDRDTVKRIAHLLYIAEYKRRQSAPGVKITARNFGRDRRYPITNRFREDV